MERQNERERDKKTLIEKEKKFAKQIKGKRQNEREGEKYKEKQRPLDRE